MAEQWRQIAHTLGISPIITAVIAKRCNNDPEECLLAALVDWLKRFPGIQRRGPLPSWRSLVEAVASPSGGDSSALAELMAQKYSGKCQSFPCTL